MVVVAEIFPRASLGTTEVSTVFVLETLLLDGLEAVSLLVLEEGAVLLLRARETVLDFRT